MLGLYESWSRSSGNLTILVSFASRPVGPGCAIDAICGKEGRVYSETNLPRGFGITAEMTDLILSRLQARAVAQGRATCVKPFTGAPKLIFKADKTPEIWVRWGLC